MQAHTTEGLHPQREKAGRIAIPALVRTGAIAGLAGGMVMGVAHAQAAAGGSDLGWS